MPKNQMFDVDVDGLRKVAMRRGAGFILLELLQNALDEDGASMVDVILRSIESRRGRAQLIVMDNSPSGFRNLADAWTLYGDSYKRNDPEKRGFMDLGEKLVISVCEWAEISTTTGTVRFADGVRTVNTRQKRESGTRFEAVVKLNREQVQEALGAALKVIRPSGKTVRINDQPLPERELLAVIDKVTLPTIVANEEGELRPTRRQTSVQVYRPRLGEAAMLYEMGIPVVETGDEFHYVVQQRVPLNADRDNVPPAFLRDVRVAVLNATVDHLDGDQAAATWVREAVGQEAIDDDVARAVLVKRYGNKVVGADPSDPEATKEAVRQGYTVVYPRSLTTGERAILKRSDALRPAGQVFPTKNVNYSDDPNAPMERVIEYEAMKPGMRDVVSFLSNMGRLLLERPVAVVVVNETIARAGKEAWYGSGVLHLNVGRLGYAWFERGIHPDVVALGLHEFSHERVSDHLSKAFPDEIARLAGEMTTRLMADSKAFVPPAGPRPLIERVLA